MKQILTFAFLLLLLPAVSLAQVPKAVFLKGEYYKKPLAEFIREMETVHQLKFNYVEEVIKEKELNGILKYKTPFETAFTQLLKGTGLLFYINSEGGVVIYENQEQKVKEAVGLFTLRGKVTDKGTGEPIPFVHVFIPSISKGGVTDEAGFFEIKPVEEGNYSVKFHFIGYKPLMEYVKLHEDMLLDIQLEEAFLELKEVTVTPGTFEISTIEVSPLTLGKEEILHSPNFAKDIYRTLRILPGVVSNDFSAKIRVRGGHSDEVAVYLDNFPIKEPFHLEEVDGAFSIFNTDYVEELKVLTGGFSAKYTDRLSGIMDVRSYDYTEHDQYNAFADLLNLGLTVQKKIGDNANVFLAARQGYLDALLQRMYESAPGEDQALPFKPRFHDLWSKINFEANRKNQFSANLLYAKDDFWYEEQDDFKNINLLKNIRDNTNGWLNWKWFPSSAFSALTTVGYQEIGKDATFKFAESIFDENKDKNRSRAALASTRLFWEMNDHHSFEAGLEGERFFSEYFYHEWRYDIFDPEPKNIKPDTISVDNRFDGFLWAGYIQDSWKLGKLIIQPGLRASAQSFSEKAVYWSPRLAVSYQIMESLNAKLGYGIYYQPDSYYKLRAAQGQLRPFKENARNIQYTGSLNYDSEKIHLQANVYYKDYTKLLDDYRFEFFNRMPGIMILDRPFHTATGMSRGVELMARKPYGKNLFMLSYALAENKIFDKEGNVAWRDFDQRHSVVAENIFRLPAHWDISLLWRFHTGHPYTPVEVGFIGRSDFSDRAIMFYEVGEKNSKRLTNTHSLDFKIEKSWFFRKSKFTAYVNIVNLYNRENMRSYWWDLNRNRQSGQITAEMEYQANLPFFISPGISYTLR